MVTEEKEILFTEYHERINDYFTKKDISLIVFPVELNDYNEQIETTITFSSADSYVNFLKTEIAFWKEFDPSLLCENITNTKRISSALQYFNNAVEHSKRESYLGNISNDLDHSISSINGLVLYSKTSLAIHLVNLLTEGKQKTFFDGFKFGMYKDSNHTVNSNKDFMEGFVYSLAYKDAAIKTKVLVDENTTVVFDNINSSQEKLTDLEKRYTEAFYLHQKTITDINNQTTEHINTMKTQSSEFFEDCTKRRENLEKLYEEKLMLKAPAQYWKQMEEDYEKEARKWLNFSIVTAAVVFICLMIVLANLSKLITEDSSWTEIFKNSAIATVSISVGVYILRLFVKLATSSYHLARDAKERNKLSYFYLALKENGAVTEKERAIILNALFSRADTGLLKGDSSPTMPTNATDLIEKLGQK